MATYYSPKAVTNGLTVCLDAANKKSYPSSGTSWTDLSGNINSSTLTNGPTFSTSFGGGIVFDGIDDYVSVPYTTNPTYFSFELAFSSTLGGGTVVFAGKYNGSGNDYWLGYNGSSLNFSTNGSGLLPGAISASTPYVVTCVLGASSKSIYINGTLSATTSTTTCAPAGNICIGRFGDYNGFYSTPTVFSYKYYNREISADEVVQNYNALKSRLGL